MKPATSLFFELFPDSVLQSVVSNDRASAKLRRLYDGGKLEQIQFNDLVENGTKFCKYSYGNLRAIARSDSEMEIISIIAEFHSAMLDRMILKITPPCGGWESLRGSFSKLRILQIVDEFSEFNLGSVLISARESLEAMEISGTLLTEEAAIEMARNMPPHLLELRILYKHWMSGLRSMIYGVKHIFMVLSAREVDLRLPYRAIVDERNRDELLDMLRGKQLKKYRMMILEPVDKDIAIITAFSALAHSRVESFYRRPSEKYLSERQSVTLLKKLPAGSEEQPVILKMRLGDSDTKSNGNKK